MEVRATEHAHVDPQSEEWFASFPEEPPGLGRGPHRSRHRRRRAPNRKQRERLANLMMLGSVLLLGAMTAVFYSVLTR
jgi:hypothetical protein